MKFNKILSLAFLSLGLLTACSDDDFNTAGDVTISMKDATIEQRESNSFVKIPIKVNGKANGDIRVWLEVVDQTTEYPTAKEDEDYIITSKCLNIPAGVNEVAVEFRPIWKRGTIDDTKAFAIKITKVEGAKLGTLEETNIVMLDVDNIPYFKLMGPWTLTATDGEDIYSYTIDMQEPPEGDPYHGKDKVLYAKGIFPEVFGGTSDVYLPILCLYNEATGEVDLSVTLGEKLYPDDSYGYTFVDGLYPSHSLAGSIPVTTNDDLTELLFKIPARSALGMYGLVNGELTSLFQIYTGMKMTR